VKKCFGLVAFSLLSRLLSEIATCFTLLHKVLYQMFRLMQYRGTKPISGLISMLTASFPPRRPAAVFGVEVRWPRFRPISSTSHPSEAFQTITRRLARDLPVLTPPTMSIGIPS
jgi:hypothetical protein